MFVQVITGTTQDPAALLAQGEKWASDVRPHAVGFVGSTVGVTDDGRFICLAQFTDDVAAKENSELPQQTAWYEEFAKTVDQVVFRESSDTALLFGGPSPRAGFVQVMESKVTDRAKAEALESPELLAALRQSRPDLLGSLRVWLDDGTTVEAAYFTSEADARQGETSSEFGDQEAQFGEVFTDTTYLDLANPQIRLA